MYALLAKSPYFNERLSGRFLDEPQRGLLKITHIASLAQNYHSEKLEPRSKAFALQEEVIKLKKENKNEEAVKKEREVINLVGEGMGSIIIQLDETGLSSEKEGINQSKEQITKFISDVEGVLKTKNPNKETINDFVEKIKNGEYEFPEDFPEGGFDISSELERYGEKMKDIEFSYNAFDLQEKSRMAEFDQIGISTKGIYLAYLEAIKEDPEMAINKWDEHFTSGNSERFGKLTSFLEKILPESKGEGKADFLSVFSSLNEKGVYKGTKEVPKAQAIAILLYGKIKREIQERTNVETKGEFAAKEIEKRLKGETWGDKIVNVGKGMLFLPSFFCPLNPQGFPFFFQYALC